MKFIGIIYAIIAFGGLYGWVANIIKLANAGFDAGLTVEIALRVVGVVVVPLGAVMGIFV